MRLTYEEIATWSPPAPRLRHKFCWHCGGGLRKGFALQLELKGKTIAIHRKCAGGLSFEERARAIVFKHGKAYRH